MKRIKNLLAFLVLISIFASCSDDDSAKNRSLQIEFSNTVANEPLVLNTGTYTNKSNESYTVKELKYIVSNIVLIKENGEEFVYPVAESYFLINEADEGSKKITLSDIPGGEYNKIRFGIGVDQSKYPIESGTANFIPTAEDNDMLWNWAAGYKFVKFEGLFTPEGGVEEDFLLHVGSHGANLDNYKEVTLESLISITGENNENLNITSDIAKIFDSVNIHSLQEKASIQVDPEYAPIIAENVQTMFSAK